ncbi:MAG: PEP-CTERM sorting domain-containing protein [Phycisphaerae bacterium]|nr:PEP-CTERM sorting domain-containing protein [Phycisphaerae bacterium]
MLIVPSQAARDDYDNGGFEALADINEIYGGTVARVTSSYFKLEFAKVYNILRLADIYQQSLGDDLLYANPNYYLGDGSTIMAFPPSYTFVKKWGDCPSGCMNSETFTFTVANGQAVMVPEPAGIGLLALGVLGFIRKRY